VNENVEGVLDNGIDDNEDGEITPGKQSENWEWSGWKL